jgi:hypothetical protein
MAVLAAACGQPPEKEMQQAQAAIAEARTAGADRYAVDEFTAAVAALKNAESAVAQRDFRLALNHALDSRARAQTAAGQAHARKLELRARAEATMANAAAQLESVRAQLKAAEGTRSAARALAPLRAAVADGEQLVQEARTALEREDYEVADTAAAAATATLAKASADIRAAIAPAARRRR